MMLWTQHPKLPSVKMTLPVLLGLYTNSTSITPLPLPETAYFEFTSYCYLFKSAFLLHKR